MPTGCFARSRLYEISSLPPPRNFKRHAHRVLTCTPDTVRQGVSLIKWRAGLLLAGLVGAAALIAWPASVGMGSLVLVFFIAMAEEAIGRWLFYARRNPGI